MSLFMNFLLTFILLQILQRINLIIAYGGSQFPTMQIYGYIFVRLGFEMAHYIRTFLQNNSQKHTHTPAFFGIFISCRHRQEQKAKRYTPRSVDTISLLLRFIKFSLCRIYIRLILPQ